MTSPTMDLQANEDSCLFPGKLTVSNRSKITK